MLKHPDQFTARHIGPNEQETQTMLTKMGLSSLDQLVEETLPAAIRLDQPLDPKAGLSEYRYLQGLQEIAAQNKLFKNYIGLGYYGCITPSVILRNIFENPGWYTQYTPYQAEISQGRLEALLNFQTVISDLCGLPIANASLLDEGTAAAEAMSMTFAQKRKKDRKSNANVLLVDQHCFPQTIDVLRTRAKGFGLEIKIMDPAAFVVDESVFAALVQYPNAEGEISDYRDLAERLHAQKSYLIAAADLMSLCLLEAPGNWGADVVVGSAQRLGVPMGYGGPHAAYFATSDSFLRLIPGRIIGVSVDRNEKPALRMTLQTREQHIKRDRATSNICTAQALLAIMAGMYAVYHGPAGMKAIASRIHSMTSTLKKGLEKIGLSVQNQGWFDTLTIDLGTEQELEKVRREALEQEVNFHYNNHKVSISLDETTDPKDIRKIMEIFASALTVSANGFDPGQELVLGEAGIPDSQKRESEYLSHPVFNTYHSETAMMRYIKSLENKDLSLNTAMIPLGSCTMKLNAATELIPVSWPAFAHMHPFAPMDQTLGYQKIVEDLGSTLCTLTGFEAISFQPNSGAQGEYTGLMVIRAWHESRGDHHRNIALIPDSAHGTNPASAVMAGMKVVVVKTDEIGNIDLTDLQEKAEKYADQLSCLMITYPSTFGVFEAGVKDICQVIHDNGGQVYMDGANMNAQVGLTSPGFIGADVCHLNLHKTFSIPHGGGGPGMGPICVAKHLAPFLPGHVLVETGGEKGISAVSSTPYGSSSILLISYAYCELLGIDGMTLSTKYAILNANYMKSRLEDYYEVLFQGKHGRVAHEFILDLREFKSRLGLEVDDITKRLIDYGFHAPTVSWPVAGTIMIEPTESEPLSELDRFCDAMIAIREEIREIETGQADAADNVLKNAPHTLQEVTQDDWKHHYGREKAAFPVTGLYQNKFWPAVARVNNTYGDRNVVCTCPPLEAYAEEAL